MPSTKKPRTKKPTKPCRYGKKCSYGSSCLFLHEPVSQKSIEGFYISAKFIDNDYNDMVKIFPVSTEITPNDVNVECDEITPNDVQMKCDGKTVIDPFIPSITSLDVDGWYCLSATLCVKRGHTLPSGMSIKEAYTLAWRLASNLV